MRSRSFTKKTKEKNAGWVRTLWPVYVLAKITPISFIFQPLRPGFSFPLSSLLTQPPLREYGYLHRQSNSMYWLVGGVSVGPFISSPLLQWGGVTGLTLLPACAFMTHQKDSPQTLQFVWINQKGKKVTSFLINLGTSCRRNKFLSALTPLMSNPHYHQLRCQPKIRGDMNAAVLKYSSL